MATNILPYRMKGGWVQFAPKCTIALHQGKIFS